jgi:protein SCO1
MRFCLRDNKSMKSGILLAALLAFSVHTCHAREYSAAGLVLRVDPFHRTLLLSCDSIPGFMNATMILTSVRDSKTLARLVPGLMVDFTLEVDKNSFYAGNIQVRDFEDLQQQSLAARRMRIVEDLEPRKPSARSALTIGQRIPRIVLRDQNRTKIDLSGFAGKIVLISFFYTHCPLPDYCFRLSNNLGNVQRRFKARMGRDLILLSVTFDPAVDQPEVLGNYARIWNADPNWHFLNGPLPEVRRVCDMFGVNFWPNEAELMHSLHTVMVDRQGRLIVNLEGNQFTPQQLGDLVQAILDGSR